MLSLILLLGWFGVLFIPQKNYGVEIYIAYCIILLLISHTRKIRHDHSGLGKALFGRLNNGVYAFGYNIGAHGNSKVVVSTLKQFYILLFMVLMKVWFLSL